MKPQDAVTLILAELPEPEPGFELVAAAADAAMLLTLIEDTQNLIDELLAA